MAPKNSPPPQGDAFAGPQLYLIAPAGADADALAPVLAQVLDRAPVACLRISAHGSTDEGALGRLADMCRDLAHARDVAVVIDDHLALAQRHGLDGVHLSGGARGVREARKALGPDAIIGAHCATSRHEGLNAAEAGADYVTFGPVGDSALGTGETVDPDLFTWWSEVIEVPVVAEGALTAALVKDLSDRVDFIALGPEIWGTADPAGSLAALWPS